MVAPVKIHISETESLSLHEFCTMQAEHFTKLHSGLPLFYTSNGILDLIHACTGDGELKEPMIEEEIMVAKEICKLLTRSREIEEYANAMTREADIEKAEMAQHLIEVVPIVAIPESEGQQEARVVQETQLTVLPGKQYNSQEHEIIEAAKAARLDNCYSELRDVFDFDDSMLTVKAKDGAIPTPADYGKLAGFGFDLGRRAVWLMAEAVNHLLVIGHEHSVVGIADAFGMSPGYTYNLARTAQRVRPELRVGIIPTVAVELSNAHYSDDKEENQRVIEEAIQEARDKQFSCAEARSYKRMKLGCNDPIEEGQNKQTVKVKLKECQDVLQSLLNRYFAQAKEDQSWDETVLTEPEVMASMRVLGLTAKPI